MPSLGNVSMFTFGDPPTSRAIGYSQIAMFQPNSQTVRIQSNLSNKYVYTHIHTQIE